MKVFGVVGWKNTGKTGLMERLVADLSGRGLRVSTIKHAHHGVDVDQPGKDSYRHRQAGAVEVVLASAHRWALMHELRGSEPPQLSELLAKLSDVDLVLVEGFKSAPHPKVEAYRGVCGQRPLAPGNDTIVAVAIDTALDGVDVPQLDLDDTAAICGVVLRETGLLP